MLKLGTAKVDITPSTPVALAGFSTRSGVFERVRHAIHARILCLESLDQAGSVRRSLIVSADLIWWGSERVQALKQQLSERCGVDREAILLHATHSHSGPQTSAIFVPSIGVASPAYLTAMEALVVAAAERAAASLEPVQIEIGSGVCPIGIHRRKENNGRIEMAPNPAGPNDPECTVVRFRSAAGKTKALLVHFTCHPTTTAANEVSPEFPGLAMQELEDSTDGLIAVFTQGCCGDIRPNLVRGDAFYRGGDDEVQLLGRQLAMVVQDVLDFSMTPSDPATYHVETTHVPIDFAVRRSWSEIESLSSRSGIEGEWARLLRATPERLGVPAQLEVTSIALAKNLSLLAFNAEMVVEYGLWIKKQFGGRVLPLAYTNGMIGYVTTARQLAEGGYEPIESTRYFGLPGPFATDTEARILSAISRLEAATCGR